MGSEKFVKKICQDTYIFGKNDWSINSGTPRSLDYLRYFENLFKLSNLYKKQMQSWDNLTIYTGRLEKTSHSSTIIGTKGFFQTSCMLQQKNIKKYLPKRYFLPKGQDPQEQELEESLLGGRTLYQMLRDKIQ